MFRRMDDDGNKNLNIEEFSRGLREMGLEITDEEIREMFNKFDTDGSGSVNMDEFLVHVRVKPLPKSKKYWTKMLLFSLHYQRPGKK